MVKLAAHVFDDLFVIVNGLLKFEAIVSKILVYRTYSL